MVAERGNLLRKLTYDQLRGLADKPTEYLTIEKRRGKIATYLDKESMPNGAVRVAIQGFLKIRFFPMFSQVAIDGFYKYPDETTSPFTREDEWEFD
jgi:hypothetical protein